MTTIIPEEILEYLYQLMDVEITDFDCGQLCTDSNNGVPFCCDVEKTVPVLFNDEYDFISRKFPGFWQKLDADSPLLQHLDVELDLDIECFAVCPGCQACNRSARALVCRLYPFEPYCDEKGNVVGITFNYDEDQCPLLKKDDLRVNPQYIKNSMTVWRYIFQLMPEYQELFTEVSQGLRDSGREFKIFNENNIGVE